METSMRQTIGNINVIHSSHKWLPEVLSCEQHCSALSTGCIPRLGFADDFEDSKSTSRGSCAFLEVVQLSPLVGCARSKRQYPTVLQIRKLFREMLDCEWVVLRSRNNTKTLINPASGNRCETGDCSRNTSKSEQKGNRDDEQLSNLDYVPTTAHSSQGGYQLYICWR